MRKLLIATAALLALSSPALAQTSGYMANGQTVTIAQDKLDGLGSHQIELILKEKARIDALPRRIDRRPLPNGTRDIPDARTQGWGDCKSMSVAMRNRLIEMGYNPNTLILATTINEIGEDHMVLLIQTKKRAYVYDSRVKDQLPTQRELVDHGYRFTGRESAPNQIVLNWDGERFIP